jgi:hypothetical protein
MFSSPELTYEADVPYFLRYMLDNEVRVTHRLIECLKVQRIQQILALSWLKIPAKQYDVIEPAVYISHCQLEVSVEFVDFAFLHYLY